MMKDKAGTSKHRRMMTPLAAILLCAVAMIGLGQAMLMPTVENSANTVDKIDALSIDLYKDSNGSNVYTDSAFSGADITFVKKHSAGGAEGSKYYYAINSGDTVKLNLSDVYLGIKGASTGKCTVDVTVSVEGGDKINPFNSFTMSCGNETKTLSQNTNTYSGSFVITKDGANAVIQKINLIGNISTMSNGWTPCEETFDPAVGKLTVEFTISKVQASA